ncbi:MAG: hypothetical protein ACXVCR_00025 [Bdellovibrio sp.]
MSTFKKLSLVLAALAVLASDISGAEAHEEQRDSANKSQLFVTTKNYEAGYISSKRASELGEEPCRNLAMETYQEALEACYNAGYSCCGGPRQQSQWLDLYMEIYKSPGFVYMTQDTDFVNDVNPYFHCSFKVAVRGIVTNQCPYDKQF